MEIRRSKCSARAPAAGRIELKPMLRVLVVTRRFPGSVFFPEEETYAPYEVAVVPCSIECRNLPPPPDNVIFSGAVGDFTLDVKLTSPERSRRQYRLRHISGYMIRGSPSRMRRKRYSNAMSFPKAPTFEQFRLFRSHSSILPWRSTSRFQRGRSSFSSSNRQVRLSSFMPTRRRLIHPQRPARSAGRQDSFRHRGGSGSGRSALPRPQASSRPC